VTTSVSSASLLLAFPRRPFLCHTSTHGKQRQRQEGSQEGAEAQTQTRARSQARRVQSRTGKISAASAASAVGRVIGMHQGPPRARRAFLHRWESALQNGTRLVPLARAGAFSRTHQQRRESVFKRDGLVFALRFNFGCRCGCGRSACRGGRARAEQAGYAGRRGCPHHPRTGAPAGDRACGPPFDRPGARRRGCTGPGAHRHHSVV
jgi:hypothetical protein